MREEQSQRRKEDKEFRVYGELGKVGEFISAAAKLCTERYLGWDAGEDEGEESEEGEGGEGEDEDEAARRVALLEAVEAVDAKVRSLLDGMSAFAATPDSAAAIFAAELRRPRSRPAADAEGGPPNGIPRILTQGITKLDAKMDLLQASLVGAPSEWDGIASRWDPAGARQRNGVRGERAALCDKGGDGADRPDQPDPPDEADSAQVNRLATDLEHRLGRRVAAELLTSLQEVVDRAVQSELGDALTPHLLRQIAEQDPIESRGAPRRDPFPAAPLRTPTGTAAAGASVSAPPRQRSPRHRSPPPERASAVAPRAVGFVPSAAAPSVASGVGASAQPMGAQMAGGWSEATAPDGRTYYYNAAGESRWERPEE